MKLTMQIRTRTTQGGEPQRFARFLLLCFILTLTGCDSAPEPGPGTLAVTLSATGEDQPFTFTVRVAGTLRAEEFGATLFFSNLPSGDHEVRLLNIKNCEVQGENPRTVTIPDGGAAQTRFELSCVQAPRVSRIVFCSERTGQEDIYVMNEDGTGVRHFVGNRNRFDPHWSPDGRSIAFAQYVDDRWRVSVMSATGLSEKQISPGASPRWSPDGQRIAFIGFDGSGVNVINADGSGLVNLTQNVILTLGSRGFDWSPDGQRIVTREGREIYIHNSDGSGRRKLTRLPDGFRASAFPRWSPAGGQIAFTDATRLFVINADGTGLFRLTPPFGVGSVFNHTWSPDGARIAFRRLAGGADPRTEGGLYVINADGTNLVKLLDNGGVDTPESISDVHGWSPDGTRILFSRGDDLHVINADGTGGPVNLTNDQGDPCCAHWQLVPDIR